MKHIRKMIAHMKKNGPFTRLASFARLKAEKKRIAREFWLAVILLIGVIALTVLSISSTIIKISPNEEPSEKPVEESVNIEEPLRHPLTGVRIEEESQDLPQVFAMMVENAADAWPLSGVNEAFFVIEAPVEGNIPRFIVFLSEDDTVKKLGPIRSARPYYLDWAEEFSAVYGHVGGSPEALSLLSLKSIRDLDQFYESEYYYRQTTGGRFAPHNVFTSSDRLRGVIEEYGRTNSTYDSWLFKDDTGAKGDASLRVDMADGSTYDATWVFDEEANTYTRQQGSTVMKMEDGAQIKVNNVVVIATDIRTIDTVGRRRIQTVGEGDALLAQDGVITLVRWKKESGSDRLHFFLSSGEEVRMNPGKTWLHVVSSLSQAQPQE